MPDHKLASAADFRRVLHDANEEMVMLPSGLEVLLLRPPIFMAMAMAQEGALKSKRMLEPGQTVEERIGYIDWLDATLSQLFVVPKFGAPAGPESIGLGDIKADDLIFILKWLRGEIVPGADGRSDDLGAFRSGQGTAAVPGASGEAQPVQAK